MPCLRSEWRRRRRKRGKSWKERRGERSETHAPPELIWGVSPRSFRPAALRQAQTISAFGSSRGFDEELDGTAGLFDRCDGRLRRPCHFERNLGLQLTLAED